MRVLVYQDISLRHIIKANVINTINIAKGFFQNGCSVDFFAKKETAYFFKDKLINVQLVFNLSQLNQYQVIYCRGWDFVKDLIKNKFPGVIIIESHEKIDFPELLTIKKHPRFIFTSISPDINSYYNFSNYQLFPCSIDTDNFSNQEKYNHNLFHSHDFNITYCGHMYDYKGIPLILKAAKQLPHFKFHLVGGKEIDIQRHQQSNPSKNVIFYGHQDYQDVPNYLYSSDLLLIPYTKQGNKHSASQVTSPIKLFEYLATKKPTLCSDIKGIQNWVSENEVTFFKADNLEEFVSKINWIYKNKDSVDLQKIVEQGYQKSHTYSTKNKCAQLLDMVSDLGMYHN